MTPKNGPRALAGHVEAVREALKSGATVKSLAEKYGVSLMAIRYVQYGRSYRGGATEPAKPGPKVGTKPAYRPHVDSESAALTRARRHWAKNPDMCAEDVAEMYGVSRSRLAQKGAAK